MRPRMHYRRGQQATASILVASSRFVGVSVTVYPGYRWRIVEACAVAVPVLRCPA